MPRTDFEVSQMRGAGRHTLKGDEDGLVAYWPLDEGEGKRITDAKGKFSGEWTGGISWNAEKDLVLVGGRMWGVVRDDPLFEPKDQDFSVVVFYKSHGVPDSNHIQSAALFRTGDHLFGDGWGIALTKTGIGFVAGPTNQPHRLVHEYAVPTHLDGKWHCVALIRKDGTGNCFFDGTEIGTFKSEGESLIGKGGLQFGGSVNWALAPHGSLRDCSYWNRALTPAEVAAIATGHSDMSAEIIAPPSSKQFSVRVLDSKGNEIKGAAVIPKDTAKIALARLPVGSYTLEVKDETTGKTAKTAFRVWRYDMQVSPTGVLQGRSIGVRVSVEGPDATVPRGLKLRVVGTNLTYDVKGAGETDINTEKLDEGEYEVELVDEKLGFTEREKFRVWK